MSAKRRVVVTGIGIISPLGTNLGATWENLLNGKSGVVNITSFDTTDFSTKFAGLVQDFNVTDYMSAKDAKKCDEFIQYGIASGTQAVIDSGLEHQGNLNLDRIGVLMGSGIGGISSIESSKIVLNQSGPRRISPFFIPSCIINMTSGHLSIKFGFKGPNLAVSTACTTGTHAIGLAARTIAYGDADVMLAGGSEKASTPLGMSGFSAARALSTRNDEPEAASRPWDKNRDGFVLGDGAGSLVLEEYEHAKKRNAKIYAELVGFGMSGDAFHMTRPSGDGAFNAMQMAMQDGNIVNDSIGYINAHATSTLVGDLEESKSIIRLLGEDNARNTLISSTKSMTGHLLGAAGAIEAIFTIMAIRDQVAPPTINLEQPEEDLGLDYVANQAKPVKINYALSNSFGFGGTNGSIIFKRV